MKIIISLIAIFGPVLPWCVSLVLSGYVTYSFALRKIRDEAARKFREEKYEKMLENVAGFYNTGGRVKFDPMMVEKFLCEARKIYLYASDDVCRSVKDFADNVSKMTSDGGDNVHEMYKAMILCMRKDLMGKTRLQVSDVEFYRTIT
jgi:hypothetical protein